MEPARNESLLESMTGSIKSGKMSYYIFVAASIPAVGWWYALPPFPQVADAIAQWFPFPNLVIGVIYACVGWLVWAWSNRVDQRMESVAQHHWQRRHGALRKIFTDGRTRRESESVEETIMTAALVKRSMGSLKNEVGRVADSFGSFHRTGGPP